MIWFINDNYLTNYLTTLNSLLEYQLDCINRISRGQMINIILVK